MGNNRKDRIQVSATADALFPSVQKRVLAILFGQPERRFHGSRELIELVGSGTGATHRVVKRLAEAGLVREEVEGRQKYYRANAESPVFDELAGLKAFGVGWLRDAYRAGSPALRPGVRG